MDASIYRLRLGDILAICVLALLVFGVLMVDSASASVTNQARLPLRAGLKQLIFVGLSIPTFFIVGRLDYSWLGKPRSSKLRSPAFWAFILAAGACAFSVGSSRRHVGQRCSSVDQARPRADSTLGTGQVGRRAVPCCLARAATENGRSLLPRIHPDADSDRDFVPAGGDPGLRHRCTNRGAA